MAHSIEIRVPYVDPFFLAGLPPGDVLASVNAKATVADVPQPGLPAAIRQRPKTGFATPVGDWIGRVAGEAAGSPLSAASRAWALKVWRSGWNGPVAV